MTVLLRASEPALFSIQGALRNEARIEYVLKEQAY